MNDIKEKIRKAVEDFNTAQKIKPGVDRMIANIKASKTAAKQIKRK